MKKWAIYLFESRVFFVVLALAAMPLAGPAESSSDNFGEQPPFGLAGRHISLGAALELNRSIQSGVESGKLTLQQGRKARDITLDLRRYLAELDAEIRETEDLILEMEDRKRFEMLRHFSRLVARRERALIGAWLALKDIGGAVDSTDSGTIGASAPVTRSNSDRNGLDVEIELVPEDRLMEDLE